MFLQFKYNSLSFLIEHARVLVKLRKFGFAAPAALLQQFIRHFQNRLEFVVFGGVRWQEVPSLAFEVGQDDGIDAADAFEGVVHGADYGEEVFLDGFEVGFGHKLCPLLPGLTILLTRDLQLNHRVMLQRNPIQIISKLLIPRTVKVDFSRVSPRKPDRGSMFERVHDGRVADVQITVRETDDESE